MSKVSKVEKNRYIEKIIKSGKSFLDLSGEEKVKITDEAILFSKKPDLLDKIVERSTKPIDTQLLNFIANRAFATSYIDPEAIKFIKQEAFELFPTEFLRYRKIIPINIENETVEIISNKPNNELLIELIKAKTNKNVKMYYAPTSYIEKFLKKFIDDVGIKVKVGKPATSSSFAVYESIYSNIEKIKETREENIPDDTIISLLDNLIKYSIQVRASDLHIEPQESLAYLRFRIDGLLHKIFEVPLYGLKLLLMRVKILSKMRTDEHARPQDGKFRYKFGEENFDIRVSIIPVYYGEKIVFRILKEEIEGLSLDNMGLDKLKLEIIERNITKSYGMILSTGPTGSGKTTTLYGIVRRLNNENVNIMTVEDPIEYTIPMVNQIEVNESVGLTFAKGLRSILRQDPNIIMVGEIRDRDTAFISINASLTGHLVLSTLHTNNAASSFVRLLDFDVEPFLIASSINLVIGQRLVRKICDRCKKVDPISIYKKKYKYLTGVAKKIIEKLIRNKVKSLYRGEGCQKCSFTGYYGRTGVFELLETNDLIRSLIMKRTNSDEINKVAVVKNHMQTMLDDAVIKIKQGITTFEEVIRLTLE